MAEWKKVITSGSSAELAHLSASGGVNIGTTVTGTTSHDVLVIDGTGNVGKLAQSSVTGNDTTYTGSGAIALASNNTFSFAPNLLGDMTATMVGTDEFVVIDSGTGQRKAANEIDLSIFSNTTSGFITSYVNTTYTGSNGIALASNNTFSLALSGSTLSDGSSGVGVANNSIGATQLNISGDGSDGQFLESDGDGSFSWTTVQITDTTYSAGDGLVLTGTQFSTSADQGHVTEVGALAAGSITSNFGAIANGGSGITSTGTISGSTINALTANISNLQVNGNATMTGSLTFNGVSFTETATGTTTGSHVWGTDSDSTHYFSGSVTSSNGINVAGGILSSSVAQFNSMSVGGTSIQNLIAGSVGGNITTVGTVTTGTWNADTIAVAYGGTGVTSFADKSVIVSQDSGTDQLAAKAMTTNGSLLIGGSSGPEVGTLTAGAHVTVSNADGAITLSATNTYGLTTFQLEDADGTEITIGHEKEVKFTGSGITINWTGTDNGTDGDPYLLEYKAENLNVSHFDTAAIQTSADLGASSFSDNETSLLTAGAIKDYIGSQSFSTSDTTYTAGDGLTLTGTDFDLDAALTTVTSIYNTGLKIGRGAGNDYIDFSTNDEIEFKIDNGVKAHVDAAGLDVFGNISASGNFTINGAATIAGNLTVAGTTTYVNTETIQLADNFIELNSDIGDSAGMADSGITVKGGAADDQTLYYDVASARWSLYSGDTPSGDLAVKNYIATVSASGTAPSGTGGFGADAATAVGQMVVHSDDIYIYV